MQIDESIKANDVKPIFTDGFLITFRIKAKSTNTQAIKVEDATPTSGLIELTLVDEGKQQALGRYVIDRETAENLSKALTDTITKLDSIMIKGGLTKLLPKSQPKPTDSSYR